MPKTNQHIADLHLNAMRIAGADGLVQRVGAGRAQAIAVFNPFTAEQIGSVPKATLAEVQTAFAAAQAYKPTLTRFERAAILNKAAALIAARRDEIARLITAEAGLSLKDALYESGRVSDVFLFGATEVLKDDGQIFSCDLTPHGKKRRVYTQRSHGPPRTTRP